MLGRGLIAATIAAASAFAPLSPARAEEEICVGVVVDFQQLAGAPASPSEHCAKVPNRSTGYDVLLDRARALGRPAPRMENGLLCAIDGLPERGCGESGGGGYRYWAYFHRQGDGAWQYSSRGATDYRVIDDPARTSDDKPGEGWVWVDGGAEGSVRPAAVPYDEICPPAKSAASRTPTPRASPSTSSGSSPAGPGATPPSSARSTAGVADRRSAVPRAASLFPTGASRAAGIESTEPSNDVDSTAPSLISLTPSPDGQLVLGSSPSDDSRRGLPTSTIAGIGVVALLAGIAAVRLRRGVER